MRFYNAELFYPMYLSSLAWTHVALPVGHSVTVNKMRLRFFCCVSDIGLAIMWVRLAILI
jgi:hypothetical protein